jgi:hypothetical protein
MRYAAFASLMVALLAGCGGETPTPVIPTAAQLPTIEILESRPDPNESTDQPGVEVTGEQLPPPTPDPTTAAAMSTMNAIVITPLPPPGTLVVAAMTTEQASAPFTFALVVYTQRGGVNDVSYRTEIRSDGTVIRDGQTTVVSPAAIAALNDLLNQSNFFNIQGTFTRPGLADDAYEYSLRVDLADGSSRTLFAHDGLIPPELLALFLAASGIDEPTPAAVTETVGG